MSHSDLGTITSTNEQKSYYTLISWESLAVLCVGEGGTLDKLKVDSGVRRKSQQRGNAAANVHTRKWPLNFIVVFTINENTFIDIFRHRWEICGF